MNRSMKVVTGVALLAGAGLLFARHSSAASAPPPAAQDVYLDKCSVCHGPDGPATPQKEESLK